MKLFLFFFLFIYKINTYCDQNYDTCNNCVQRAYGNYDFTCGWCIDKTGGHCQIDKRDDGEPAPSHANCTYWIPFQVKQTNKCDPFNCDVECTNGGSINYDTCTCNCPYPYAGLNCEINVMLACYTWVECFHGGFLTLDCSCNCPSGWTGQNCDVQQIPQKDDPSLALLATSFGLIGVLIILSCVILVSLRRIHKSFHRHCDSEYQPLRPNVTPSAPPPYVTNSPIY